MHSFSTCEHFRLWTLFSAGASNLGAEIYTSYSDLFVHTPAGKIMMRFGIALAADLTTSDFSIKKSEMYLDEVNVRPFSYRFWPELD